MREQFLPDVTDKIRLSYLSRSVYEEDLIAFFCEKLCQVRGEFTFKHSRIVYIDCYKSTIFLLENQG